ncbi:helix-turn-helix domain-containing protein [Gorillibacterium sp. CAU 1737]|uniref:ArsR/SmtB family transcription factor n=1 Tax=Gorillibacterium sp. CAU 1737 TaxID=3140362 RepID=UPI0032616010
MSIKILTTPAEVKAITDPYRMQILHTLMNTSSPMTVSEVAAQLGDSPAKVHYHMKILEKNEIVSIVETKAVNGILAKYYNPTAGSFQVDKTMGLPPGDDRDSALRDSFLSLMDSYRKEWSRRFASTSGFAQYMMITLTEEKATELRTRLEELIKEYAGVSGEEQSEQRAAQPGEKIYQLFVSFFGEKDSKPEGSESVIKAVID